MPQAMETVAKGPSAIKSFFAGKNLFMTGVSGFCGRIFLYKVLKDLESVGKVYVMLRPKRGEDITQRLEKLLNSQVFSFHSISAEQRAKVIPVGGDLSDPNLLENNNQSQELFQNVHFIYHLAASVKFDADFRTQFETNVQGTENVIRFANQMKNLEAFVHMSTAYSNCQFEEIEERLYPLTDDIDKLVAKIRALDHAGLKSIQGELFQGRPNSYVFTKAMGEHIVARHKGNYPCIILRPAIVSPAVSEPAPGYVDSFNGPAGFSTVSALGIAKLTDWEFNHQVDVFPVDFLANACLVSAWLTKKKAPECPDVKIFHLNSSTLRPENNYELLVKGEKVMRDSPSLYVIRPHSIPPKTHRMSALEFKVKIFYAHVLFAYIIDFFMLIFAQKPIMRRVVDKMHYAFDLMKYFANREWRFHCDGLVEMMNSLEGGDRETFDVDITRVPQEYAISVVWLGVRRYLLKEDNKTIPIARIKYKVQNVLYGIYQAFILYWTFRLFTYWSPLGIILFFIFGYITDTFYEIINCVKRLVPFA